MSNTKSVTLTKILTIIYVTKEMTKDWQNNNREKKTEQ